jgi:uncharacterized membrane protein YccC
MRALTKLEKTGLVAAVVIAGSYFYLTEVVEPLEQRLASLSQQFDEANQEWAESIAPSGTERFEQAIERLQPELEEARRQWREADTLLPDTGQAAAAVGELVAASGELGLRLNELAELASDSDAVARSGVTAERPWRHYRLRLTGPYAAVVTWFERLAQRQHAVLIDDVSLKREPQLGVALSLILSL